MQKLMEDWRRYVESESESTSIVLEEGIMDNIQNFFRRAPNQGRFDPAGQYPPGSYGEYAQANGVLAALKDQQVQASEENLSKVAQSLVGAGKAGPLMTTIGMVLATSAVPPVGIALTVAGVGATIWNHMKKTRANPDQAAKFPILTLFQIDPKWREILDDNLETAMEEKYKDHFEDMLQRTPEAPMIPLNDFLQQELHTGYAGRNVTKP
jgi:hypothetical protein